MNKVIFDTNIYSYAAQGYFPMQQLIKDQFAQGKEILMPSIVQAELFSVPKGLVKGEFKRLIHEYIEFAKESHPIVDLKEDISKLAGEARILCKKREGKKLALPDALIASTAIVENATLYSHNDKDFSFFVRHYGLNYENPIAPSDLDRFLHPKGKPEDRSQLYFRQKVERLTISQLNDLAKSMFVQLPQNNKTNLLKHLDHILNEI